MPRSGDVVFSYETRLGEAALIPASLRCCLGRRMGLLRPKGDKVDACFLLYAFLGTRFQETLRSRTIHGSTVDRIPLSEMGSFPIELPRKLEEQRAIAHVLGTLDDKIELNRRMNQTLEEMARALFKSWFVDFDPVRAKAALKHHAATPPQGRSDWSVERARAYLDRMDPNIAALFSDRFVDSELGPIPAGWEVKALGHFGEIITGKTPSTRRPEYYGEDVPFLRIPDMHRKMYALETELMLSMQGVNSQPQKTLPPGSISVSCIATLGLVVLNHHRTQTNQQINSIIPYSELVSRYIFWTCRHLSSQIETGGLGGSVFGNMNKSTFAALRAVYPGSATVSAYDSLISPLHASILANDKQAHILAAQRDALLPKLVSGEVRAL